MLNRHRRLLRSASNVIRKAFRSRTPSTANTTIGPLASNLGRVKGRVVIGRTQTGRDHLHALSQRHRPQESDAGQRFHIQPDVHPWCHMFQLPRCSRHGQQCRSAQARQHHVPQVHWPQLAQRSACASIEQHTHHKPGSRGAECIECRMPKIEQTIADVNVRARTFRFVLPGMTASLKIPNPCTTCHTDKSLDWASAALKSWTNLSPWRVAN